MKAKNEMLVYVVDDDPVYLKALELFLEKEVPDIQVRTFSTGEACLHEMYSDPDLLILDYYLNTEFRDAWDGMTILKKISWHYPYTTVVMLSSQESIETAMDTINEGAFEYIVKNEKAFLKIKSVILNIEDVIKERND